MLPPAPQSPVQAFAWTTRPHADPTQRPRPVRTVGDERCSALISPSVFTVIFLRFPSASRVGQSANDKEKEPMRERARGTGPCAHSGVHTAR